MYLTEKTGDLDYTRLFLSPEMNLMEKLRKFLGI